MQPLKEPSAFPDKFSNPLPMHAMSNHLLHAHCMPGTVLMTADTSKNENQNPPCTKAFTYGEVHQQKDNRITLDKSSLKIQ